MSRRGFATILVVWVVAVSAVLLATLQAVSLRQASEGREALARVRAYWAARGGVEATIARLENDTEDPDPSDPYRVVVDMEDVAQGEVDGAEYVIRHTYNGVEVLGPADAHAKMNIATMSSAALLLLPYMGEDMADAIVDWMDSDDDVSTYGAESSQYQQQAYPYLARNGPARTLAELELVLGVEPEYVRGDDQNLNGVRDPGEGTGGEFETEWSELITPASVDGGLSITGQARLDLPFADPNEVAQRLTITSQQAEAIVSVAAGPNATIGSFISTPLPTLAQQAGVQNANLIPDLTDEQLALLIGESTIGALLDDGTPKPGKININTAPDEVIELLPVDIGVVDALIAARNSRGSLGFASIMEIIEESPLISRQQLAQLYDMVDVRSNVYIARCVGRDTNTGIEVEIIATLDRSTLPVVIREVRVR